MNIPVIIASDVQGRLNWHMAVKALAEGHNRPRSELKDMFLHNADKTFMSRAAWVEGIGIGVKNFTVFPDNSKQDRPSVQGLFSLFDEDTGALKAQIDFALLTYWKTAADSLLAASHLVRKGAHELLIIGTGVVARSLVAAYSELFPELTRINIYGRNIDKAKAFISGMTVQSTAKLAVVDNFKNSCLSADIISAATGSRVPVIHGEDVTEGTHIDLIGAFKADMREADDALMQKGRIFVDSFETTAHIGEIKIPLEAGHLNHADILGDHYDICSGKAGRQSDKDITIFKNGGGAHLDVMIADLIYQIAYENDKINKR